jgi:hypothetical protein
MASIPAERALRLRQLPGSGVPERQLSGIGPSDPKAAAR